MCSTVTRVSSPTASNRTSTSVIWSGSNVAWRQPNTRREGGDQMLTLPISNTLPDGRVWMRRPPSPGSKASTPGSRGVKANSGLGRHQRPIWPVKASKACSGRAATLKPTRMREAI